MESVLEDERMVFEYLRRLRVDGEIEAMRWMHILPRHGR